MVGIGTGCFLQLPGNSKQRVLHPVLVMGLADEICTVKPEENGLPIKSDMDVLLYFEKNRKFMQQSGRIEAVDTIDVDDGGSDEDGPQLLISFKTTGAPVSAESRQHYRVSTVIMGCPCERGWCARWQAPVGPWTAASRAAEEEMLSEAASI